MAVLGMLSYALEVPDIDEAVGFYSDAGLEGMRDGNVARFHCHGQDHESVLLLGGHPRRRLHHVALRADRLDEITRLVPVNGGRIVEAPDGFGDAGLWVRDPHGMLLHLVERPATASVPAGEPFEINGPGRIIRKGRSAIRPVAAYAPVRPLKLGHVLVFTPDVLESVRFVTDALGMGLADRAQDVVAFCCARKDSDHHVLAFAKSEAVGFHHGSFEVRDPDEVGRGGQALLAKTGKGDWGFGRHTIGSNFFHYIQDPWGSWFEYYSDIDYIEDHTLWSATNYGMEDALANWGPAVPDDFIRNYEADALNLAGAR